MHSRGFTLVELLVVMTISAILIAAAVPHFNGRSRAIAFQMRPISFFRISSTRAWSSRRNYGRFAAPWMQT